MYTAYRFEGHVHSAASPVTASPIRWLREVRAVRGVRDWRTCWCDPLGQRVGEVVGRDELPGQRRTNCKSNGLATGRVEAKGWRCTAEPPVDATAREPLRYTHKHTEPIRSRIPVFCSLTFSSPLRSILETPNLRHLLSLPLCLSLSLPSSLSRARALPLHSLRHPRSMTSAR